MSIVSVENSIPAGVVHLPPSKSAAHRALICSFLAGGGQVEPLIDSDDMRATQGALQALLNEKTEIDCIESGSTLRFLIPVAAVLGKTVTFVGRGRLPQRPLDEYSRLLPRHGVTVDTQGGLPYTISGKLKAGNYEIAGNVSSQYITGLLLALPLADGDSAIRLTTALESKPYVDMTIQVMEAFGVYIRETDFGYLIKGNQHYKKTDFHVESDWSQAAFFMAVGAIGSDITIKGVNPQSLQGDKVVCQVMQSFGAQVETGADYVRCAGGHLKGTVIDARDIPDMVPAIAVTAAFAQGETIIKGAARLRLKESDRLRSIAKNLSAMGVHVEELPDGLVIQGGSAVQGAALHGCNDHRIVMAFAVAAAFAKGNTTIDDAQSIHKSYPSFFEDFNMLGGKANVLSNRK